MRTLAELVRAGSTDDDELRLASIGRQVVIELLAAQAVAVAAYEGRQIAVLKDASALVERVAGYPGVTMVPPNHADGTIGEQAAVRVCNLVKVSL